MILSPAEGNDDPWIAGYLRLRQAVLDGSVTTEAEIGAYAAEIQRGLPSTSPPPASAALIVADIKTTFPLLTDQLWTP
ncbi:MAG: hypothetical protein ACRDSZ_17400 [Pseudonocardiaceae bacterium]